MFQRLVQDTRSHPKLFVKDDYPIISLLIMLLNMVRKLIITYFKI
jgi:hypothetical protein